jgi:V/A-type H+-transporting ATPase subunit I
MFYAREMTEIELVVPERDVLAITEVLASGGIFHQIDASYLSSQTGLGSADEWRERASALAALERRLLAMMDTLGVEEGSPHPANLAPTTDIEAIRSTAGQLEREAQQVIEELADEQETLQQLQRYVEQLEPLLGVSIEVSALRDQRYIFSMLGTIPVDHVERLKTSLARIPFVLLTLHQDNQQAVVLMFGTRRNADILERAARSAYLSPLALPDMYHGTPREIVASLRASIEQTREQIAEHQGVMTEMREVRKAQLHDLLWHVRAGRAIADAMARFGKLRYTYLIVGWVPTFAVSELTQKLREVSQEILVEANPSKRGHADRDVPVALNNPGILRAFQQLVTIYARPRYEEIDPTVLIALTFPLLFGAMFGDVGHGLVLTLLGALLASRRVRSLRSLAGLGVVVIICGLVAMGFGFLYGSVFGLEHVLPALWIRPMESIMQILVVAIVGGFALLSTALVLGIWNAWVERDWGKLLFANNGLSGLMLYWSLAGLVAGALIPDLAVPSTALIVLATISGSGVMLSDLLGRLIEGHRPLIEGSLGTYVVQSAFELFETLISFLSNSLSYVRVGAFAVAHGGLSAVILILAEMVSPAHGPGYWAVLALGNLFVIGFEGMIVAIQTLRLEYYEFFSKFFKGGGTRYVPLAVTPDRDR